jgi:hypothetical protein
MKPKKASPLQKLECLNHALSHPDIALKQLAADFGVVGYATLQKWVARARAAAYCAEEGQGCMSVNDFLQAADHYHNAAEQFPIKVLQPDCGYFEYKHNHAYALFCAGESEGDKNLITHAIQIFSELAYVTDKARFLLPWAYLQNDWANALTCLAKLGDRRALQHAVGKYQTIVNAFSKEENPNEWGLAQQNLGRALSMMASVKQDPKLIKAAIGAFREASDVGALETPSLDDAQQNAYDYDAEDEDDEDGYYYSP